MIHVLEVTLLYKLGEATHNLKRCTLFSILSAFMAQDFSKLKFLRRHMFQTYPNVNHDNEIQINSMGSVIIEL